MKPEMRLKNRQGGAVAVMVGISMILLVGFLAMVIDLGHLYIAKSELQNGADAAALSGAKELNGTAKGVESAINFAVAAASKNKYDFASSNVATSASDLDIWVCDSPDSCTTLASTAASDTTNQTAAGKTFLKVDTRNRDMTAWFAPIWNIFHVSTYGMAVAGRYTPYISPMAVCAVRKATNDTCEGTDIYGAVHECGFWRGVAYNLPDLNPISNGDPIWINPIDSYPGPCDPNHTNVGNMVPFLCTGRSTTMTSIPGEVWVNTGSSATLEGALNSRFGDNYTGGNSCDPATAPPDTNVKEFFCTRAANPNRDNYCSTNPGSNAPQSWMDTINTPNQLIPYHQTIETSGGPKQGKPFNYNARLSPEIPSDFSRYGVLWSFIKEMNFSLPTSAPYNTSDWPTLYGGSAENYPASSPASTPYSVYVVPPTGTGAANAKANRRVLNMAIIDCEGVTSIGATCNTHLPVLAIGQFFMQRRANLPQNISGEFAGIFAPPMPPSDIRLYR